MDPTTTDGSEQKPSSFCMEGLYGDTWLIHAKSLNLATAVYAQQELEYEIGWPARVAMMPAEGK
jgi:hypothetical protein